MSKTFRDGQREEEAARPRYKRSEEFRCRHCRAYVVPLPFGGRNRNHCPFCLYSRHVDEVKPGDRASLCGGSMAPIGRFTRPNGEHVVVHLCQVCGLERHCRVGADDDFDLLMSLPEIAPRLAGGTGYDLPLPDAR